MTVFDAIGAVGVICIVGAYALLQARRISSDGMGYSLLNAVGAALVLVSLSVDFNGPAAVVEGFWLLISVWGIVRAIAARPR